MKWALIVALAATLAGCASSRDDVRVSGVRQSNHATNVQQDAYTDWCWMYGLRCPRGGSPSTARRPIRALY